MDVLDYLRYYIFGYPTKLKIGPRSKKIFEIYAKGTSEEQQKRILLLDYLAVIGLTLEPTIPFELHEMSGDTFTLNKKDIYICLENAQDDLNTFVFVFLHELSHVICKSSQQHDNLFRSTFANLKNRATLLGLYKVSYKTSTRIFCGKKVDV
jgi:hypothetical protein